MALWDIGDADTSNLQVWLDSSDASTITQEGTTEDDDDYGTSNVVSAWVDKSSNAHEFGWIPLGAYKTTYTEINVGPLSGTSAIKFGGVDGSQRKESFLTSSVTPASGAGARTVFTVVDRLETHRPADSHNWRTMWGWGSTSGDRDGKSSYALMSDNAAVPAAYDSYFIGYHYNEFYPNAGHREINTEPQMTICEYDGTVDRFYYRCESSPSTNTKALDTGTSNKLILGGSSFLDGGTDYFLLEMIIYDSVLAEEDRVKVEGYLAHKWGFQSDLPSDHTWKNSAPTSGDDPFPYTDSVPQGKRFSNIQVDNQMSQLATQYKRGKNQEGYVPFRLSVRGPSNLRLRSPTKVYKVTKE